MLDLDSNGNKNVNSNGNKLLIRLNDAVKLDLDLAYVGCRTVDNKYTYNKLIMSLISNSLDSKPSILVNDSNMRFYTFKECYDLGVEFINNCIAVANLTHHGSREEASENLSSVLGPTISEAQRKNIVSSIMSCCEVVNGEIISGIC